MFNCNIHSRHSVVSDYAPHATKRNMHDADRVVGISTYNENKQLSKGDDGENSRRKNVIYSIFQKGNIMTTKVRLFNINSVWLSRSLWTTNEDVDTLNGLLYPVIYGDVSFINFHGKFNTETRRKSFSELNSIISYHNERWWTITSNRTEHPLGVGKSQASY